MKIRSGFVSNSSSSSFILKFDKNFPDTISIAESMLKNKFEEYGTGEQWWLDSKRRSYKNIEHLKKGGDPYVPIYFSSINYNTYIIALTEQYVFVDTCNNTQWDIEHEGMIVNEIPDEVLKKYPGSEYYSPHECYVTVGDTKDEYGDDLEMKYNKDFYLIEHGLEMTKPDEYRTCKKCYNDMWILNGKEYCLGCDHDIIMRGLKIKKLMNVFRKD